MADCPCCRLCQWDGATPAGAHPLPDRLSVGQEGTRPVHHVLDALPVRPLGRRTAARDVPQTSHDRRELSLIRKPLLKTSLDWSQYCLHMSYGNVSGKGY